jgi:REP element-mobilizing transposase RayT
MVRWYHSIFSAYGFWMPNDPRGSWSDFVASWELFKFGPATKTTERRSLAKDPHDVAARLLAKRALKYPPVRFTEDQRDVVGSGFARAVQESSIVIHACCIGYDHVHVVVARHMRAIERTVSQLKARATQALRESAVAPDAPSPWAEGCWRVFINDDPQLREAVSYVERHPMKEGLAPQIWSFVTPLA